MPTFLDFASLPNAKQVAKMERCISADQEKLQVLICKSSSFHVQHRETNRNTCCSLSSYAVFAEILRQKLLIKFVKLTTWKFTADQGSTIYNNKLFCVCLQRTRRQLTSCCNCACAYRQCARYNQGSFERQEQNVISGSRREQMRTAIFWVVTQLIAAIYYRRFGTT